jgi:hypothetical protein
VPVPVPTPEPMPVPDQVPGPVPEPRGPRAIVNVMVDYEALTRGHVEAGETCEITGVGLVPVATVRAMAADCILKVLLTKGVDVIAVAHGGRSVSAHQRSALEARDPECVVPGCNGRYRLEIDHVMPWATTRTTTLSALARLCRHHHFLKTHRGWQLSGGPGQWSFDPPPQGDPSLDLARRDTG